MYLDENLSFEPFINYITFKITRVINLLKNLMDHVSDKYMRSAYFCVLSLPTIISYGILF